MNCPLCDKPTTSGGTTFFLTYGKCHDECMDNHIRGIRVHKPEFQLGQEVEVKLIGTVEGIEMDEKGKPYYRVVYRFDNTPKSDMAFCHEDSLSELPEPTEFIGGND